MGSSHYYYGNYCKLSRYPAEKRQICKELLSSLESVGQEERQTVKQRCAKELGSKETTILHQLYYLYEFDFTRDFLSMLNIAFYWVLLNTTFI